MLVGLTGGIGSGKTAAADYFAELGIDVVDADLASRAVVEPGKPALAKISEHFGPDILLPDGALDRAKPVGHRRAELAARVLGEVPVGVVQPGGAVRVFVEVPERVPLGRSDAAGKKEGDG